MAIRKSSKLPQTAVLKQILKRCSSLGKKQHGGGYDDVGLTPPLDVPKGHFAVYVGENRSSSGSITIWDSLSLVKKSFFDLSPPRSDEDEKHSTAASSLYGAKLLLF
ncbi:hypothetical protein Godav_014569 [Gossypium davidsonii]|uniref:Uncharacterized protein n=1 Tax=Gossypium davidsonii TaxID=34287 RepID=A0A7J8RK62_GOSDV|nr:hypothetical protein [Gossypium davidsonii]